MANFSLTLDYSSGMGYAGQKFPIGVKVSDIDFSGDLTLSVGNAPAGSVITYFPHQSLYVTPVQDFNFLVTIDLPKTNSIVGIYDIVITGSTP